MANGTDSNAFTKFLDNTTAMAMARLVQLVGIPLGLAGILWMVATVNDSEIQLGELVRLLGPNPDLALRDERITNLQTGQVAQGKQLDRIELSVEDVKTEATSAAAAAAEAMRAVQKR